MLLPYILVMQLCSVVGAESVKAPRGLYTPRNWTTAQVRAELYFLNDSTVKYKIYTPQHDSYTLASFPTSMLASSIVAVNVPRIQMDFWMQNHPGAFNEVGLTVFFYDPVLNRITVNPAGASFELLHESDPAEDAGNVTTTSPDGIYQSVDEISDTHGFFPSSRLEVTMGFWKERGRALYRIVQNNAEYSFPFEVNFFVISSSLIRVLIPQNQLHGLHGRFPGLSNDFFYMNLGYDPKADVISLLLNELRVVTLKRVQTFTPASTSAPPTSTAKPTANCSHRCRPFGDFCVYSNTARMSLSFKDQHTTTLAALYKGAHLLAGGARYDVIEESDRVVISVDVINSALNDVLREINWLGFSRLNFTFDPDRNVVMLETRGLIAHMYSSLGCAAAIEAPPKEPSDDEGGSDLGPQGAGDFIHNLAEQLLG
ncbi:hypothetical protein FOZ61_004264 [Perkinsus olseni]|uniref:Uncharacterized protein n=1 Tax=Perkinsus olseni TaxID=32597 RepID=A0A7J6LLD7_PEROL|nr:hypothetical protein FOZ61_004264 [Perkinsus olseni]KAF4664852.1 hypothetical protein FOL46_003988 [Perkinsus olseni]